MKAVSARIQINILAATGFGMLSILDRFPPEKYGFYPACPLFHLTHLYCAGCGATRALAALLHGRFADAWHYNALLVVLLPLALAYGLRVYWVTMRRNEFLWPAIPRPVSPGLVMAVALFAVLRNTVFDPL